MFLLRRGNVLRTVKRPVESVWYGIEPLMFLCKMEGFWTHVSSGKFNLGESAFQKSCYLKRHWLGKETVHFTVMFLIAQYIAVINVCGEQHNYHQNTTSEILGYVIVIVYGALYTLPRLLTLLASSKFVELVNNMADLDTELQVRPEDCQFIRKRSFIYFLFVVAMIAIHTGLCSVNLAWWTRAGQSDFVGYLSIIVAPSYAIIVMLLILTLAQVINTLAHRFQVITTKAVNVLELTKGQRELTKCRTDLVERATGTIPTLAAKLDDIRQKHEFLQENVKLFHSVNGALIGFIIPIQIFLIITESFTLMHKKEFWYSQKRMAYFLAVALRMFCWTFSIVSIFRAADNLKSQMVDISSAIQKRPFLHLQPDEQLQIQLLTSIECRSRAKINPAGFFTLSLGVIPSLVSNFATFFIVQFQTFMGTETNGQSCKNVTCAHVSGKP